jgi:hypothetical protein
MRNCKNALIKIKKLENVMKLMQQRKPEGDRNTQEVSHM